MIKSIIKDRRGAPMTEYAILIGLLALIVLAAVKVFGANLKDKVTSQANTVKSIGNLSPHYGRLPLQSASARTVANRPELRVS